MRDYTDETDTPISQMSTADIENCLMIGFTVVDGEETREAIIERLRLELYIRQNGLRNGL